MPKLKTHKGTAKRIIKLTKRGKFLRKRLSAQHLARKKSKRTRTNAGVILEVKTANTKKIKRLLPWQE